MSTTSVTWLDLLHELCLQSGYALLLTAEHQPFVFADRPRTELRNLDVVEWRGQGTKILTAPRRELLLGGELIDRAGRVNGHRARAPRHVESPYEGAVLAARRGAWKRLVEAGAADAICDRIVREREPPVALLVALGLDIVRTLEAA